MADNTVLNTGTGGDTIATDDIGGVKYQIVKAAFGALDTATLVSTSAGLPVQSQGTFNVTVNAALPAGAAVIGHVIADSGSTTAVTQATGTNLHAVIDTGSTTAVTQATGTNLHAVIDTGSTTAVTQATGSNLHMVVDSGTVTTVSAVTAITNALPSGSNVIGHVIADSGSTTAVTGTVTVTEIPATSGGLSMSSVLLAASNNLTSVKASAGQVYAIQAFGTGSAPYWLKLYNKASAPVVASDSALIVKRILIPANATAANGAGVVLEIPTGLIFSTGIAYSCVGLQADADTTNTAATGAVNIDYK